MAKNKRKKSEARPGPEARELLARAAEDLLGRLPVADPGSAFQAAVGAVPGLEAELIEALAGQPSESLLEFLVGLSALPLDKKLLKAVRRAVYRLEQAGLKVPDEAKPKGVSLLRKAEQRAPTAYLSGYDPDGARMGLMSLPALPSGYDAGLFVIHDTEGLTEFLGMHLTGGEVRRMLKDLGREFVSPPVAVPPGLVRFLLNQAAARSRALKRPVHEDYEAFAGLASMVPPLSDPLIYQVLNAPEVAARVNLPEAGPVLLTHESMLALLFYDEVIPYLEQLKEAESSVLVLSDAQREERDRAIVDRAAREIVTGERREFFKHQLEELAFYLWQKGETDLAETAVAAALDTDREAVPETEYSFAREAVRLTFTAGFKFLEHETETGPDAADGQETESGLIIPGQIRD